MLRSLANMLCLLSGMLFVPVTLALTHAISGDALQNIPTSPSAIILYYIPLLGVVATLRPRFTPLLALAPLIGIAVLEAWGLVPGHAPLSMLGRALVHLWPEVDPELLGKAALLVCGAAMPALAMLHKATRFRLVTSIMGCAQCGALVLFYFLLVAGPMDAVSRAEQEAVTSALEIDGDMERLCALEQRACMRGSLASAKVWSMSELRQPAQAYALIDDTSDMPRLRHSWIEEPSFGGQDQIAVVTALKHGPDDIELVVSVKAPSMLYAELLASLNILIAFLHAACIALGLAFLAGRAKHGTQT